MTRTVAIVGAHADSRHLAPYDDPAVEIWVFNESGMMDWCPRVSAVFQPHLPTVYKNPKNRADEGYWAWLQGMHDFPIYLNEADPEVPASVRYPLEEILEALPCEPRMFTSSATYALAYAGFVGVDVLQVYGIEASFYAEYKQQREAIAYWVGFLQGRGVKVDRHCADGIFVNPLYGRENIWYQEPAKYEERLAELRQLVYQTDKALNRAKSAEWVSVMVAHYVTKGRLEECQRYYDKVQAMLKIEGAAILDRTELERAAKDLLPQIDAKRMAAQQALGMRDYVAYKELYSEASRLTGRWQENQDMLKAAPYATTFAEAVQ